MTVENFGGGCVATLSTRTGAIMMPPILIREYQSADAPALWQLFYDTIHKVNIRNYSLEQVNAWAPLDVDLDRWTKRFESRATFVAEDGTTILGFAELESSGHIDRFYCHAECQGQGVGTQLLNRIEGEASSRGITRLYTEASITALPFFERRGFIVIREQEVECRGVLLTNFVMTKTLQPASDRNCHAAPPEVCQRLFSNPEIAACPPQQDAGVHPGFRDVQTARGVELVPSKYQPKATP